MNAKWYIGTLFFLFTLFGAFQEQVTIPNQEIVLEFVDVTTSKKNIDNAIADVKEKLLKVGVSNIKIQESKNGTLKISYFSVTNIDNIKEVLLDENAFVLNKNSENNKKIPTSFDYRIDVYELTNQTDISNQNDKFVFEIKYNSDRFTTNFNFAFVRNIKVNSTNQLFKTAYKANKNSSFTKDYTSYNEPEVRAGPHKYNS